MHHTDTEAAFKAKFEAAERAYWRHCRTQDERDIKDLRREMVLDALVLRAQRKWMQSITPPVLSASRPSA